MTKKTKRGIVPISKCCKSPVKIKGIPDFIGDNKICTISYSCSACGKPCDIYVSPKEQAKIDKELLKEKLECILDNLLCRFLPRPAPRFEKYVKGILDDRNKAVKEIIEVIHGECKWSNSASNPIKDIFEKQKTINLLDMKLGTELIRNSPFCCYHFKSQECGYKGKKFISCNKTKKDCRARKRLDSFEKYVWNGEKIKG